MEDRKEVPPLSLCVHVCACVFCLFGGFCWIWVRELWSPYRNRKLQFQSSSIKNLLQSRPNTVEWYSGTGPRQKSWMFSPPQRFIGAFVFLDALNGQLMLSDEVLGIITLFGCYQPAASGDEFCCILLSEIWGRSWPKKKRKKEAEQDRLPINNTE